MFIKLKHQQLDVYCFTKQFVLECYKLTKMFPGEEKYGIISQIRRAALSVHLNVAEGASRKSPLERKRFYEIARGSLIEVDSALDIADELNYLKGYHLDDFAQCTVQCFKTLSGLISKTPS